MLFRSVTLDSTGGVILHAVTGTNVIATGVVNFLASTFQPGIQVITPGTPVFCNGGACSGVNLIIDPTLLFGPPSQLSSLLMTVLDLQSGIQSASLTQPVGGRLLSLGLLPESVFSAEPSGNISVGGGDTGEGEKEGERKKSPAGVVIAPEEGK